MRGLGDRVRELDRQGLQLSALTRVARRVASAVDEGDARRIVVGEARALLQADTGVLLVHDGAGGLRRVAHEGPEAGWPRPDDLARILAEGPRRGVREIVVGVPNGGSSDEGSVAYLAVRRERGAPVRRRRRRAPGGPRRPRVGRAGERAPAVGPAAGGGAAALARGLDRARPGERAAARGRGHPRRTGAGARRRGPHARRARRRPRRRLARRSSPTSTAPPRPPARRCGRCGGRSPTSTRCRSRSSASPPPCGRWSSGSSGGAHASTSTSPPRTASRRRTARSPSGSCRRRSPTSCATPTRGSWRSRPPSATARCRSWCATTGAASTPVAGRPGVADGHLGLAAAEERASLGGGRLIGRFRPREPGRRSR